MKTRLLLCALAAVFLVACDSPERTVQTARKQLNEFQAVPDSARQAAVEQTLAKLDGQIAELEKKGDVVQVDLFRRQAASLKGDFQAARLAKTINDTKNAIKGIGEAMKDAGKSFSETLKNSAKDTNE